MGVVCCCWWAFVSPVVAVCHAFFLTTKERLGGAASGTQGIMKNHKEQSCGSCFKLWQNKLEHIPEFWLVRHLPTGELWSNKAVREWLNFPRSIDTWNSAIRWCFHADVAKLEDAFSRCIKTNQPQSASFRLKADPTSLVWVDQEMNTYTCDGCTRRCAMVLILAQIRSAAVASPAAEGESSSHW